MWGGGLSPRPKDPVMTRAHFSGCISHFKVPKFRAAPVIPIFKRNYFLFCIYAAEVRTTFSFLFFLRERAGEGQREREGGSHVDSTPHAEDSEFKPTTKIMTKSQTLS